MPKFWKKNSPNPRYHNFNFIIHPSPPTHPPTLTPKELADLEFQDLDESTSPKPNTHTQTLSPKLLPRSHVPGIVARVVGNRTVNKLVPEHWRVARVSRAHGPAPRPLAPALCLFRPFLVSRARALASSIALPRATARSIDRSSLPLSISRAPRNLLFVFTCMCICVACKGWFCSSNWKEFERVREEEQV